MRNSIARTRAVYDGMAAALPGLLFMNSGLVEDGAAAFGWIRAEDLPHKYHLALVRRALEGVDLAGRSVLEIGSGRGGNCYYLSRYTGAHRAIGVDSSIGNAIGASRLGAPRTHFICADAASLPFRANAFGVVLDIEWSPTYPQFAHLLGQVQRVLAPGGSFIYMDLWNDTSADDVWCAKREALWAAPLELTSSDNVTEDVFRALGRTDGLEALLRRVETDANRALIERILGHAAATRESLAVGYYIARILRFTKKEN
ncbi:MAG TPA: methyltransferase domain-containing protein [Thermoanaerobaculia bacterium]|nr:methyltransferase domain-containing protein [Thermoanaerobaculia bacterium]